MATLEHRKSKQQARKKFYSEITSKVHSRDNS